MPIIFTFDMQGGADYNRIQSFFERFGWESLGGSSYRYPPLGSKDTIEDWFNQVVPALMLFREYVVKAKKDKRKLTRFTLDVQSSSGYNSATKYGTQPLDSTKISLGPASPQFPESKLREWLSKLEYPYS